jgi:uncharacterized protein YjbI with pentapeptide repeats
VLRAALGARRLAARVARVSCVSRALTPLCSLEGVTLFGADLAEADFTGANLKNSNLGQANLTKATLVDADCSGAILSSARLDGAVVTNADFTNVIIRADLLAKLCAAPTTEGTNPVTGEETRMSLMCP